MSVTRKWTQYGEEEKSGIVQVSANDVTNSTKLMEKLTISSYNNPKNSITSTDFASIFETPIVTTRSLNVQPNKEAEQAITATINVIDNESVSESENDVAENDVSYDMNEYNVNGEDAKDTSDNINIIDPATDVPPEPVVQLQPINVVNPQQWEKCLKFSYAQLIVVEIYSSFFGPCEVMDTYIQTILENVNCKVQLDVEFIRIDIGELEKHIIHENINKKERDTQSDGVLWQKGGIRELESFCGFCSPIPTYLFFKNGHKVAELKGAHPKKFQDFVCDYAELAKETNVQSPKKRYSPLERNSFGVIGVNSTQTKSEELLRPNNNNEMVLTNTIEANFSIQPPYRDDSISEESIFNLIQQDICVSEDIELLSPTVLQKNTSQEITSIETDSTHRKQALKRWM